MEVRKLKASEVDVRVAQCSEKGVSLLLYNDAIACQRILDDAFGAMGWKRSHQLIGGLLYCTVEAWDKEKKEWIAKQDVGTQSATQAEKGQASDSFKRACVNFGIGRELRTAPFIWVGKDKADIKLNGKDAKGKERFACYDKFGVQKIDYNDKGEISYLEIVNHSKKIGVFKYERK